MLVYLLLVLLFSGFTGSGVYFSLRALTYRFKLDEHDSKGYFLLGMLMATLINAAIAFFGGSAYEDMGWFGKHEFLPESGALLSVAASVIILSFGLKKVF